MKVMGYNLSVGYLPRISNHYLYRPTSFYSFLPRLSPSLSLSLITVFTFRTSEILNISSFPFLPTSCFASLSFAVQPPVSTYSHPLALIVTPLNPHAHNCIPSPLHYRHCQYNPQQKNHLSSAPFTFTTYYQ